LEEEAVAALISILSMLSFSARNLQTGLSFVREYQGQQVAPPSISIWDDGLDPCGLATAIDAEGIPKRHVPLIQNGVAEGVVYDSYTAHRDGRLSTGHAVPAWLQLMPSFLEGIRGFNLDPMCQNLFMACGSATVEDMVRATRYGILVTRFNYVRPLNALRTIATGMTRDGIFLIEGGEIVGPVSDLRFTENILDALNRLEIIGSRAKLTRGEFGVTCYVPALKLRDFQFTSVGGSL